MGAAPQFDRQVFAAAKKPPARDPLFVLAPVLFAAVVAAGGFMAYQFIFGDKGDAGSVSAEQISAVQQKLAAVERRLEQLERKRRGGATETPVENETKSTGQSAPVGSSGPTRIIYRITQPPSQRSLALLSARYPDPQLTAATMRIDSLQRDVAAGREEWEATANRLGSVVGELDSQRVDIDRSKERLDDLVSRFDRQEMQFSVERKSGRKRVGPVAVRLESTDPQNGRYTMQLELNDRWVELRNRSLNESMQFYTAASEGPLELVVNHIAKNQIAGKITVPRNTSNR